ncbi:MAG: hypothetical protein MZV63_04975 [Marinilabiliales bacterium]|nr:hypothetical protein [Marinilabiliales bacterium]
MQLLKQRCQYRQHKYITGIGDRKISSPFCTCISAARAAALVPPLEAIDNTLCRQTEPDA